MIPARQLLVHARDWVVTSTLGVAVSRLATSLILMTPGRKANTPRGMARLHAVQDGKYAQQTVHIGHAIRARREMVGLTQERAAALAGITRNALRDIEGKPLPNPTLSTLLSLMRVYRLQCLDELLGPTAAEVAGEAWSAVGWEGGVPRPLS